MKFLSLAVLALAAVFASAQNTSTPVPDACIIGCTEAVCLSLTNFTCFCDPTEQQIIGACIATNCTSADLTTAEQLDALECPSSSSSSSTPPATSSSPAASSSSPPTTTTTAASSASSAAAPSSSVVVFTSSASTGGLASVLALAIALAVTVGLLG